MAYPDTEVSGEELRGHCREALTTVKVPVLIDIVAELPKNPVGKIDMPDLRRTLQTT